MYRIILSVLLTFVLFSCKTTKSANCDAYGSNQNKNYYNDSINYLNK